jgi:hypothetical protein
MNRALSGSDILDRLAEAGIRPKLMRYDELKRFKNITQLLGKSGAAVVLYPSGHGDVGHWTCVFYTKDDRGRRIIEFFDPYGISVDNELRMIPNSRRRPRLMARLLTTAKIPVSYNEHQFQKFAGTIATCGRHVVSRLLNKDMPLSVYSRWFGKSPGVTPDALVTVLMQ